MTQSNEIKNLLAALVEVQSELPTMPKDATVESGNYGYKYADLDTITQIIKPILKNHKIGYMQSVGSDANGAHILTTRIFDANGEYIEDTAALPVINNTKNNAAQVLGMSITYMRRYALCAMLGITSDEDTDANPQGNQPKNNAQQNNTAQNNTAQNNGAKQNPPAQKPQLKGGETSPEDKAKIKDLLERKFDDGTPIFLPKEMAEYLKMRTEKTAAELIEFIEKELNKRNPPKDENAQAAQPAEAPQPPQAETAQAEAEPQQDIF